MASHLSCSIGVMAYNEEQNIGKLLQALCHQHLNQVQIYEIIVIASGCNDNTLAEVKKIRRQDKRVKVYCQLHRQGKAKAVNLFVKKAKKNLLVLIGADLCPHKDTVEKLLLPFKYPAIGMTGARAIPINDKNTLMGYASHMLWDLCHFYSLNYPKMGEMIAFRKVFKRIPKSSAVDEANIEPLIVGQEYKIRYVPEAKVYNSGSKTLADFFRQRRRIYAGHLFLKKSQGYSVSTLNGFKIFWVFLNHLTGSPKEVIYSFIIILLEIYARMLGTFDYWRGIKHTRWEIAKSTKIIPSSYLTQQEIS